MGDQMMDFYVSIFDSLHFWLFHCFESGFRVKTTEKNEETEDQNETLFDAEFARINSVIRKSDLLTAPFERISPSNNSKFTIFTKAEDGDTTFIDELFENLISESIQTEIVSKLKAFLEREAFDSDSVKMDIQNITLCVENNKKCIQAILQFIKVCAIKAAVFSLGFRFYYWQYYKDKTALPAKQQMIGLIDNKHDHSGFKVCDLNVNKKYDSFGEEIRNYEHFDIGKYKQAKIKTKQYMKTEQVKKIKAKYTDVYNKEMLLHYEIEV